MVQKVLHGLTLLLVSINQSAAVSCTAEVQGSILSSIPKCTIRPTLVDLRAMLAPDEDILQIMPEHVMVDRCAGSCYVPPHSCNVVKKSVKKVPVMLVLNKWPHGEHEMVCRDLEVDVHEECGCGCELEQNDCLPDLQYFQPQSCRCVCANVEDRAACIISGKVWDPSSCQCHCPSHTWQACSSGYIYDYTNSCSCEPLFAVASHGTLLAVVLLSAALVVTVLGGIFMFRTRTGVFKEIKKELLNEASIEGHRTRLMTQKSKAEFDLANR